MPPNALRDTSRLHEIDGGRLGEAAHRVTSMAVKSPAILIPHTGGRDLTKGVVAFITRIATKNRGAESLTREVARWRCLDVSFALTISFIIAPLLFALACQQYGKSDIKQRLSINSMRPALSTGEILAASKRAAETLFIALFESRPGLTPRSACHALYWRK